jgi:uncharacterized protein (TIGR03086 family)
MTPIDQLTAIVPALTELVDGIDPMQLHDPTPCDRFTVHDVLDHMITLGGTFACWFRGEDAPPIGAPPVYGRVPAPELRAAMEDLLDAVRSPGAMTRTIHAPIGELPGDTFARFVAFDGVVHGWDLATATGRRWRLPDEVVAAVDGFARSALAPAMRDGDTFKAATEPPAGAGRIDRLAAFSGRAVPTAA